MPKQLYTINEAAILLGVSAKTLRRWEARGLLIPHRTIGNQRRYTPSEINQLKNRNNFALLKPVESPKPVLPTPNFIPLPPCEETVIKPLSQPPLNLIDIPNTLLEEKPKPKFSFPQSKVFLAGCSSDSKRTRDSTY